MQEPRISSRELFEGRPSESGSARNVPDAERIIDESSSFRIDSPHQLGDGDPTASSSVDAAANRNRPDLLRESFQGSNPTPDDVVEERFFAQVDQIREYLSNKQKELEQREQRLDAGEIDLPLGSDEANRPRQCVDPLRGRRALTRYRVLERSGTGPYALSRVELKPVTGRSHQLRVHLMSIGHAILGDPLYAPPDSAQRYARMHLHAAGIAFIHPHRQVPVSFESAVPF